jgi:hypothetical protein
MTRETTRGIMDRIKGKVFNTRFIECWNLEEDNRHQRLLQLSPTRDTWKNKCGHDNEEAATLELSLLRGQ